MWRKRVCSILLSCILAMSAIPFSSLVVYAQDVAGEDVDIIAEEEVSAEEGFFEVAGEEEVLSAEAGEEENASVETDEETSVYDASGSEKESDRALSDEEESDSGDRLPGEEDGGLSDSEEDLEAIDKEDPEAIDDEDAGREGVVAEDADSTEENSGTGEAEGEKSAEEISDTVNSEGADSAAENAGDASAAAENVEYAGSDETVPGDAASAEVLPGAEDTEDAGSDETAHGDAASAEELSDAEDAEGAAEAVSSDAVSETENDVDYGVYIVCPDGKGVVHPGQEVTLAATGWRHKDHETTYDGFLYKWEIIEGNEKGYASIVGGIEGEIGDYPTVRISFTGNPNAQLYDSDMFEFGGGILVKVTLYDDADGSGNYVEAADARIDGITLKDEYFEISPLKIDSIPVGESREYPLSIKYYSYYFPEEFRYGYNVSWAFEYDDSVIEVLDPDGNKLDNTGGTRFYPEKDYESEEDVGNITIRRLNAAASSLRITAYFSYIDHNGYAHDGANGLAGEQFSISCYIHKVDDPAGSQGGDDPADPQGGNDPADPQGGNDPSNPQGGNDPSNPQGGNDPSSPQGNDDPTDPQGNCRVWFDRPQDRVFSDGINESFLRLEGIPGEAGTDYQVRIEAGFRSPQGFTELFTPGVEYDFDGEKITFFGDRLQERGLRSYEWFGLTASIFAPDGETLLCDDNTDLQYVEAQVEYDMEEDRDMLPGWDGSVNGIRRCRIENAEHPYGMDIDYRILNVEVVRDEPWEGENGPVIVDFHRDQDEKDPSNYWWYYRTGHHGEAVLKVTYEDVSGQEQHYTFALHVGGEVYQVYMDSVGRERNAFPGGEIELYADAVREYMDENGDYHNSPEGLGYNWFFEQGGDFADIEVHDDPSRATLKFRALPDGEDWINEEVRVGIRILDKDGNETGGYDSTRFRVSSEYTEIWPLMLDRNLDVGQSIENQRFEVRRYVAGQVGYEVLDDRYEVAYEWHYDRNILRITEEKDGQTTEIPDGEAAAGNTFTFTRLGDWNSDFEVRASWTDERGEEQDVNSNNFQLWNRDYNIWFKEHDLNVYTDAKELPAHVLCLDSLGDDWNERMEVVFKAGHWDYDDWSDELNEEYYTIAKEGNRATITLTEQYLSSLQDREEDHDDIRVEARLYPKGTGMAQENMLSVQDAWFHVKTAREEYDREWDRDMLPGWDGTVNGNRSCRVENTEHPDGMDVQYYVENVEIIRDEPWEGEDGPVIDLDQNDFHREQNGGDSSDYWWYYRVSHRGEADLKVTYTDIHGQEQSYVFTLHVGGDVYQVYLDSVDRERNSFPGSEIELYADASHEYYGENGEYHNDKEGLDYNWFIESGQEYADIEVHADDHSRATLKFHPLPEGKDWIDRDVLVAVRVLDKEGNETGGFDSTNFCVRSEYTEIWPLVLDTEIELGQSLENQKFEVRSYVLGEEGYEVLDDKYQISYEWHFDENALRITQNKDGEEIPVRDCEAVSGNTFSFTRTSERDTNFNVRAYWTDWYNNQHDTWSNNYHMQGRDYRIWFENGDDDIRDDEEKTFAVNTDNLGDLDYTIRFIADFYIGEEGHLEDGREENFVNLTEGVEYTVDPSGKSVTVNGDLVERALRKGGCTRGEFYIGAFLIYQDKELYHEFCRVELRRTGKSIQEIKADDVTMTMFDSPVITVEGAKGTLSFTSSNTKVVRVDGNGKLTPVAVGTAAVTIKAATTDDVRPGVTKCTVKVTKLDLSGSAVKVTTNAPTAGYTYNKKTQKPTTVKVVYTNSEKQAVTLTAGTHYTVTWPANDTLVNAGTKTITIKAKGTSTTGTTKGTYKINKAKQTITCATTAVAVGKTAAYTVKLTDTTAKITCTPKTTASKAIATVTKLDNTTRKITMKGVKVGAAKYIIKSAATTNYLAAQLEITVNVVPIATTKITAANLPTGIKLTWAKVTGASGYYIYRGSTKIATITKGTTVTYKDPKANTNGTKYVFKVVAYATLNKKAVASTLSRSLTTCRVARTAISSAANTAAGKMTVKWTRNAKATGYQIQYSLSSSFASGNKAVTVTGTSKVSGAVTGLTKGKTYHVRIRCCKKVGSVNYFSAWSAAKTLKITK